MRCDPYYNGSAPWACAADTPDLRVMFESELTADVNSIGINQATGDGGWVW